jgi:peptidoglycan/LPS O-acetylase OafA/YrhL
MDDLQTLLINAMFLQSFHPSTLLTGIGPAWALTDVVVFYLVLPVLVFIASRLAGFASTRRGRRVATLIPAAMLLGIGLSGKAVAGFLLTGGAWDASWHAVVERSFWAHADMFALGLALATLRVDSEDAMLRLPDWWRRGALAAVVMIAIPTIAFTVAEGNSDGGGSNLVYDLLMGVVCALFVALVVLPAGNDSTVLVRLLETPVIVAFGVVSYSVFLWQEPVIFWARDHGLTLGEGTGLAVNLVLLTALTFAVSALTYRFLEFPALVRKSKRRTGDPVSRYRAEQTPTP